MVAASAIRTVIEWYNFALYVAASALVINRLFFPDAGQFVRTLAAFATFAVGFFARPFGRFVVTNYSDKVGRKPALVSRGAYGVIDRADRCLAHLRRDRDLSARASRALAAPAALRRCGRAGERYHLHRRVHPLQEARLLHVDPQRSDRRRTDAGCRRLRAGQQAPRGATTLVGLAHTLPRELPDPLRRGLHQAATRRVARLASEQAQATAGPASPGPDLARTRGQHVLRVSLRDRAQRQRLPALYLRPQLHHGHSRPGAERRASPAAPRRSSRVVSAPLFGILADRIGRKPVFISGATFVALFTFPFFFLLRTSRRRPFLAIVASYSISFSAMSITQISFLSELFATRFRYTGIAASRELTVCSSPVRRLLSRAPSSPRRAARRGSSPCTSSSASSSPSSGLRRPRDSERRAGGTRQVSTRR